jgi:hypothetical protein
VQFSPLTIVCELRSVSLSSWFTMVASFDTWLTFWVLCLIEEFLLHLYACLMWRGLLSWRWDEHAVSASTHAWPSVRCLLCFWVALVLILICLVIEFLSNPPFYEFLVSKLQIKMFKKKTPDQTLLNWTKCEGIEIILHGLCLVHMNWQVIWELYAL